MIPRQTVYWTDLEISESAWAFLGRDTFIGVIVSNTDAMVFTRSILLSPAIRRTPFAHIRESNGCLNIWSALYHLEIQRSIDQEIAAPGSLDGSTLASIAIILGYDARLFWLHCTANQLPR